MYREGEVVQAVLTCSFFFGTVIYGIHHQEHWHKVERLQDFVWAIFCAGTSWLVTVLGNRVHAVRLGLDLALEEGVLFLVL